MHKEKILHGFIGLVFVMIGGTVSAGLVIWKTLPLIQEQLAVQQSVSDEHRSKSDALHRLVLKGVGDNERGIMSLQAAYREGVLVHKLEDHR